MALALRMAFDTQQSGRDKNLNPSSGNIVNEAADEESPGQQRIGLQRGDIDNHRLIWVGNCQCVEFRRSDAEVLCEQIWGVDEAVDATIGVMQDDEVPSGPISPPLVLATMRSIAIVWSVAGVMRPPTLRITAASPGVRPNISTGSTRGSTQPIIIVFSDGMIFRSAEKRLLAKASLRWVRASMTLMGFVAF